MKPLVTPRPNLNGNSASDLVEQLSRCRKALRDAQDIMAANSDVTHGRNFQHLIRDGDWAEHAHAVNDARHAWGERCMALETMANELMDLMIQLRNQD